MRRTLQLLKQTLHPPKRTVPLAANPLTRWSRRIPQWCQIASVLTPVEVGLEGCHSAFNAINSIRTCLYFQTAAPPAFLTAKSWKSIEHVQTRSGSQDSTSAPSSSSSLSSTSSTERNTSDENPFEGIARFGEESYFGCSTAGTSEDRERAEFPIVAVENFTDRAQSLMRTRLPFVRNDAPIRLVVGHENWGVRRSLLRSHESNEKPMVNGALPVADMVVYVPQYGTISSLNVVTSLGIALFYCYMDRVHPRSRTIYRASTTDIKEASRNVLPVDSNSKASELEFLRSQIQAYQDYFKKNLPIPFPSTQITDSASPKCSTQTPADRSARDASVNTTPRVDNRPIHPVFYKHERIDIQQMQQNYRGMLLQYSRGTECAADAENADVASRIFVTKGGVATTTVRKHFSEFFGISVLYENDCDQRNFGGLIRNANAFLVDHVLYVGRRKYNVVGAVGSYHYTPPIYLGPIPSLDSEGSALATEISTVIADDASVHSGDGAVAVVEESWSALLKAKVDALYLEKDGEAPPREWWLLDCGHGFLYEEDSTTTTTGETAEEYSSAVSKKSLITPKVKSFASSQESLEFYKTLLVQGRAHNLCEAEVALRDALADGVVLIVPQEGKLPHAEIMKLCTGVLTILPECSHYAELTATASSSAEDPFAVTGHRGLPSQVASGIALQRLSAVLHPRLAAI